MVTSARKANLSALLADNTALRSKVSGMVDILAKFSQEDPRRLARFREFEPMPEITLGLQVELARLDDHYYQLLCSQLPATVSVPRSLSFYDEIVVHGVSYGCAGTSKIRNSLVVFRPAATIINADTPMYAGVVEKIFQYSLPAFAGVFLGIRSFRPVDSDLDPYRKYGFAGGFLSYRNTNDYHVIPISAIISHCALTSMGAQPGQELVHVLPLNRVGYIYPIDHNVANLQPVFSLGNRFNLPNSCPLFNHSAICKVPLPYYAYDMNIASFLHAFAFECFVHTADTFHRFATTYWCGIFVSINLVVSALRQKRFERVHCMEVDTRPARCCRREGIRTGI